MPYLACFRNVNLKISTRLELLEAIDDANLSRPIRIATVNPEFIEVANKRPDFKHALGTMSHCTIDGFGLLLGLQVWRKIRHQPVQLELYPGINMVNELFDRYSSGEKSFFFLGGAQGVASAVAKKIHSMYPTLAIVGATDGGAIPPQGVTIDLNLKKHIEDAKPDILLVAFGAPKQELWIEAASDIRVPTIAGVGGSFDFLVKKKRAPELLQKLHLEWLYRGCTEKGHWSRVIRAVVLFPLNTLFCLLTGKA